MSPAGLYVHVPFCKKKCDYCSFVSYEGQIHIVESYIEAIKKQATLMISSGFIKDLTFNTIYIGGGTPSLIPAELMSDLLEHLFLLFPMLSPKDMEITVECNPESITRSWVKKIKKIGINRISLGVQDLSDRGLRLLGRIHTSKKAIDAVRIIQDQGISNLSLDLIYCLPSQDLGWLENTLTKAISLEPAHISAYELTIEPGTKFAYKMQQKTLNPPDQDVSLALTKFVEKFLHSYGFFQYEISNFSKPGRECKHNINYWIGGQYLGLGCGAVSCIHGIRYFNTQDLDTFMRSVEKGDQAIECNEKLDNEARFRETLVMWLRMTSGAKAQVLKERFGIDIFTYYGSLLDRLCEKGVIEADKDSGTLKLTERGRHISNYVLSYLV